MGSFKNQTGVGCKSVSHGPCIIEAINKLDKKDYEITLKKIISEKTKTVKEKNPFKKKYQVAQYVISKGYEPELVWEILKED